MAERTRRANYVDLLYVKKLIGDRDPVPLNPGIAMDLGRFYKSTPPLLIAYYLMISCQVTLKTIAQHVRHSPDVLSKRLSPDDIALKNWGRLMDIFATSVVQEEMGLPGHNMIFGDKGILPNGVTRFQFEKRKQEIIREVS